MTLEEIAKRLVDHEIAADLLRAQLLARMEDSGIKRVDVDAGHVVYVAASVGTPVDVKACCAKLTELGVAIPLGVSKRRAGVRVNLKG